MISRARVFPLVLCLAASAAAATAAAAAQPTHPFSIHDMLAMERVSDPHVSPDGGLVAFSVRSTDVAANKGVTHVWLLDVKRKAARQVTFGEKSDTNPRWIGDTKGTDLVFLTTRSGSSQVWRLP